MTNLYLHFKNSRILDIGGNDHRSYNINFVFFFQKVESLFLAFAFSNTRAHINIWKSPLL